jgi:hypothetical protein
MNRLERVVVIGMMGDGRNDNAVNGGTIDADANEKSFTITK